MKCKNNLNMTLDEFKEIIRPLSLLDKDKTQFLRDALIGNFEIWKKNNPEKKICQKANYCAHTSGGAICPKNVICPL